MKACVDARTYPDLFIYPTHKHNVKGRDRAVSYTHLVAAITQRTGLNPTLTNAIITNSELNGIILPANKAEMNSPMYPQSINNCIKVSTKVSIH